MDMSTDTFGVRKLFPTKSGGKEWYSTKWNNGHSRTLNEDDFDPYDSKFQWSCGQPDVSLTIDGDGRAIVKSFTDSARLYVYGPWTNTEITVYVKNENKMDDVLFYSRSDHEQIGGCGFGGYVSKWLGQEEGIIQNLASVEVEPLHPIYTRHLGQVSFNGIPKNYYVGYKQITRTVGGNKVKVENYMNYSESKQSSTDWKKITEFTFDGTNVHVDPDIYEPIRQGCIDKGDKTANDLDASTLWLNPGMFVWIRTNNSDDVKFKWMSVREVNTL